MKKIKKTYIFCAKLTMVLMLLFAKTHTMAGNRLTKSDRLGQEQQLVDSSYCSSLILELKKKWPENRNLNFVFHGHSVPSGYFRTPTVNTFESYPLLVHRKIAAHYPTAIVNVIKTCIGGENSEQGAKRFKKDVLSHRPDVLFIDYVLNDRNIGLTRARSAWESMIKKALASKVKVILLTPTPDLTEDILDSNSKLAQHSKQIIALGIKYQIPVVDAYGTFKKLKEKGENLSDYMAQTNHINEKGHEIVANLIVRFFEIGSK